MRKKAWPAFLNFAFADHRCQRQLHNARQMRVYSGGCQSASIEAIFRISTISKKPQLDPLPTPAELPDADVVIFDGKCKFCQQQVRNLRWWDGKNRLAFVSLHDPFVAERYPDLTHEQMMDQIYVVPAESTGKSDRRYGGAAAIAYLSTRLPRLWLAAPVLHFPFAMPIWQFCYRQVAKRRYKIAGEQDDGCDPDGSCDLHFKK